MDKKERYTYYIDEYDEFDWGIIDNTTDEDYVYLEDITKVLNEQNQQIADLEAKLAEKDEKITTLIDAVDSRDKEIDALAIVLNRECDACKPNQTAIAELEKVKAKVRDVGGALALCEIEVQIDQQISELKGVK